MNVQVLLLLGLLQLTDGDVPGDLLRIFVVHLAQSAPSRTSSASTPCSGYEELLQAAGTVPLIHLITTLRLLRFLSQFWCLVGIISCQEVQPPDIDIVLALRLRCIRCHRILSLLIVCLHQLLVRHVDYRLLDVFNSLADGAFRVSLIVIRSISSTFIIYKARMSMVMI